MRLKRNEIIWHTKGVPKDYESVLITYRYNGGDRNHVGCGYHDKFGWFLDETNEKPDVVVAWAHIKPYGD